MSDAVLVDLYTKLFSEARAAQSALDALPGLSLDLQIHRDKVVARLDEPGALVEEALDAMSALLRDLATERARETGRVWHDGAPSPDEDLSPRGVAIQVAETALARALSAAHAAQDRAHAIALAARAVAS